jgi:hypothetical protein
MHVYLIAIDGSSSVKMAFSADYVFIFTQPLQARKRWGMNQVRCPP